VINFTSPIPYYLQLIDSLREKIQQKIWLPGAQIPGEQDLCDQYKISRTVVRQALKELEVEGVIIRRKGKGTFVAQPKISEGLVQKLTGFYQDTVERGLIPGTQVLRQSIISVTEKIGRHLEIAPGSKVIDIQRLRFINNEPIQLVTTYIPEHFCPQLIHEDLCNQSLYDYMEKQCGLVLARAHRFIESVSANEIEAKLLDIERSSPLLMLDSISYLENGAPVEYYHALHRGDRSRFEVELVKVLDENHNTSEIGASFTNLPPTGSSISQAR
jgi:GntR family transcriptional regulator